MKTFALKKRWLIAGVFWLLLGLTFWSQVMRDYPHLPTLYTVCLIILSSMVCAHLLSDVLLPKAMANGGMRFFALSFIVITLLMAFILAGGTVGLYWFFVHGSVYDSAALMRDNGIFWIKLTGTLPLAILINGAACGLTFYREHEKIEKNHTLLQQVHLESQLRLLQDQINPHLMFNVLNHIHILMQKNVGLAGTLLIKFSDILRYQLYECNSESVGLEREVKYLKDLVDIEKIRWGDELQVDCCWNINDGRAQIAPLLLVPFVENAFKHVARLPSKKGFVNLNLQQLGQELVFVIENSSSVQQPRKHNNHGLGLENVRKRLELLYPASHELNIEKTMELFSVKLNIALPVKTSEL